MKLVLTRIGGPEHYKKDFDNAKREGFIAIAERFARTYLPRHFQAGADAAYGYAPRTAAYLKRKGKRGKPPLVFSGRLRQMATVMPRVSATKVLGRVVIQVPRYVPSITYPMLYKGQATPFLGKPYIAKELGVISDEEARIMTALAQKTMNRGMDATKTIHKTE